MIEDLLTTTKTTRNPWKMNNKLVTSFCRLHMIQNMFLHTIISIIPLHRISPSKQYVNYSSLQFLQLEEILVTISIPLPQEKINRSVNTIHWRIFMPCEQATNFVYGSFDAPAAALAVAASDETEEYTHASASPFFEEDISPNALAPYRRTAYNVASAVRYAETYYNKTNTLFGRSGANCQNFASQCIWAGLRPDCNLSGAATSNTLIPAVSTSLVGSNAPNVWCRSQSTTYYSYYYLNWPLDNVNGFLKLILESSYTQAGPQGYYLLGISKARIGDEIAWDTTGSRNLNNGDFDHAMFVTDVNGVYGSRGTDNIFIAANTTDTTSASMPLAQYCSYPANYFATAQIVGGYYRAIEKNTPES